MNQINFSHITLLKFNRLEKFCLSFEKFHFEIFSAKLRSGRDTFYEKCAPGRTQLNGIDFRSRFLKTEAKFFETVKFEKSVMAEVYLVQI